MLVLSVAVIAGLVLVGCAPEAAPPAPPEEEEEAAPEEEEQAPPAAAEAKLIEWKLQTHMPAGTPFYKMTEDFCDRVNNMAAGQLEISPFPGGAIVPARAELDGLLSGAIDACVIGTHDSEGKLGKVAALWGNTPGGPNPTEFLAWYHEGGGHNLAQELFDQKGVNVQIVGGPINLTGAEIFGWFKKPVSSITDFKGLKFRTAGLWGEVVDDAGGAVVTLPGGEVYQAFERGVVDAFEFCCPSMDWAMGFQDLGAYMHVPGIHSTCAVTLLHIEKDKWETLPSDLQEIIKNAADANSMRSVLWMDAQDVEAMEKFKDYGTEIVILPDQVQAHILERADAMYDRYAAEDAFFAKVINSKREFLDNYRYLKYQVQPTYD